MIDCHSHLTHADFAADRPAVMARALAAGVEKIALVGEDGADNQAVLALASTDSRFLPFLGLHPDRWSDGPPQKTGEAEKNGAASQPTPPKPDEEALAQRAADELERVLAQLEAHAPQLCGVGEVGLDRWVCQSEFLRQAQAEGFRALVRAAGRLALPLNVHSRSAGRHTLDLLLAENAKQVLMHAFDGKAGHALVGAEAGYLFSIPPSIVRSPQKQKLARLLPLENLALESDSPVLGPVPGQRNEPANLALALRAVAEIRQMAPQAVAEALTHNSLRIFGLNG